MKVSLYEVENLDQVIGIATQNQSEEEWIEKGLKGIAGLVSRDPIEYRTFGIYWWPVKAALVARNLIAGTVDAGELEKTDTGELRHNLAGALMFHEHCTNTFINDNKLTVSNGDGESEEYILVDEELEAMAFAKSAG